MRQRFPRPCMSPLFPLDLYDRVAACAHGEDLRVVLRWLRDVELPQARLAEFEEPGPGVETLDRKLFPALIKKLSGDLARNIQKLCQRAAAVGRQVSRLHVLFEIDRNISTSLKPNAFTTYGSCEE